MTGLETLVAVAGTVWLTVLTFVVVLCVSQLTILTRRIEVAVGPVSVTDSGPEIGMPVPSKAEELLTYDPDGELILLMSATCGPCRTVAAELNREGYDGVLTILLPGDADLADEVAAGFPAGITVIRDPDARRYASALEIFHTPFALAVVGGTVVGKSPINQVGDLRRLQQAVAEMDRRSLPLAELGGTR